MFKYTLPALAVLGLVACDEDNPLDTGLDTSDDFFDEDPEIVEIIAPHCSGGQIVFQAETTGWTNGEGIIDIFEAESGNPWFEEHDFPSVEHGENGEFDRLELRIQARTGETGTYDRNNSSLFMCSGNSVGHTAVYVYRVYDDETGALSDCAIFGMEFGSANAREDAINAILGGDFGGKNPTNGSEISAANCTVWDI